MSDASPFDPTFLAGLSPEQKQKLVDQAGFDPGQLDAQQAQAQKGLGIGGRAMDAVGDIGSGAADALSGIGSGAANLYEGAKPYAGALAGGMLGGPMGAYVGYRALGGQEASNAPIEAKEGAAQEERQRQLEAFNSAPGAAPAAGPAAGGVPSPGGMGAEKAAIGKEAEAQKSQIEADLQKQHEMDQMVARQQRNANVQQAQDAIDKAQWDRDYMHHKNEAEDAARSVAEMKVDRNKFYENEDGSTNYGKKIGAALAMAMGAFGSAITKGPDFALEIINKAVDDDLAAQRTNIAKSERGADKKQEAVNAMFTQHREATSDEMTHRLQAVQEFRQQLQDMAAKTTDPQAKARAQSVDAAAAKQQADITHQYATERANNTFRNRQLQVEEERVKATAGKNPAAQAKVANAQAAMAALARVEAINSKSGTSVSPVEREKGEAAQQALESAFARLQGGGLSSRNKDIFEKMVGGNPAGMGAFLRKGRYGELRAMLQDEMRAAAGGGGAMQGSGLGTTEE